MNSALDTASAIQGVRRVAMIVPSHNMPLVVSEGVRRVVSHGHGVAMSEGLTRCESVQRPTVW